MMKKRVLRHRILLGVVALLLTVAVVLGAVYLVTRDKGGKGTYAEAKVVRSTLSSTLSSTGVVKQISVKTGIPLAVLVSEEADDLSDIEGNDYTVNILSLLGAGGDTALIYRVREVNGEYARKSTVVSTEEENEMLMELIPVHLDLSALLLHYEEDVLLGRTEATDLREYVLTLILREGASEIDLSRLPDDVFREDADAAVTLDTAFLGALVQAELPYLDVVNYTVSNLVWEAGDMLLLDNNVISLSYSEHFVTFALSEYDVAGIHARMQAGDRVYAAVGINALGGRELVAEIVKINTGSVSGGVSYFSLLGRLVFPELITGEDGAAYSDFAYYDEDLTEAKVKYLGVSITDNVERGEILDNYSTTVTAQKTALNDALLTDTLIVPTKCIYYDDAKKPYVVVLDADKKEKRVYIKITLSTGTDAAVTAAEGYTLNEGDVLRYTTEAGLIGSLF